MNTGYRFSLFFLSLLLTCNASASLRPNSASISVGGGEPDSLRGGRLSLQWPWQHPWFAHARWGIHGYWDASLAYWHGDGDADNHHRHKSLANIAFIPVFRIQPNDTSAGGPLPFFEVGCGPSLHSVSRVGRRNLGGHYAFEDLLGFGFMFGDALQWDMSYHFLHYSNAGLQPPNAGVDIKGLFTLRYHSVS